MVEFPRGGFDNEVPRGDRKLPCALLVDTSGSICRYEDELRNGVRELVEGLKSNQATAAVVEVMLIFFDDEVRIGHPFTNVRSLEVPDFDTGGTTHLYEALDVAYSELRTRQEQYVDSGINSYAPFIVVLTDGLPTDSDNYGVVAKINGRHSEKKIVPYPFAIGGGADEQLLKQLRADGMAFRVNMENIGDIFEFVSVSLSSIAVDNNQATLPPTISII